MKFFYLRIAALILAGLVLNGCQPEQEVKGPLPRDTYITLADLIGNSTLSEEAPNERVVNIKTKAFIKQNDLRAASRKALESGSIFAVDAVVRELLTDQQYNKEFADIDPYLKRDLQNYIIATDIYAERKVFGDKYYGIAASYKVDRQKVLVALQKDLRIINTSANTLITVVTNKKDVDLNDAGFSFSDIEEAIMNQVQTGLNQRGLRAIDYRNAVASLQTDTKLKTQLQALSKEQFLAVVSGSGAADQLLNTEIQNVEKFYSQSLTLVKTVAKVVVEVNIFAVSGNVRGDFALSFNVTAKNVSTGTGGAFANTVVNVARRGGENTIASSMIAGLVKDAYADMDKEFIPQVVKEMSTVNVGKRKLLPYDLTMIDYSLAEGRSLRKLFQSLDSNEFRYIDLDNTIPGFFTVYVRFVGQPAELSDFIMENLEAEGLRADDPTTYPGQLDLTLRKINQDS